MDCSILSVGHGPCPIGRRRWVCCNIPSCWCDCNWSRWRSGRPRAQLEVAPVRGSFHPPAKHD
eukprot:973964-Alexandrium_andersonii.AAC.1